jgi:hypothetical protein
MLVVSRLERVIEVSMWGNIAIEETIDVVHKGAAHRGFSQGRRHSSFRICFWFEEFYL